MPLDQQEQLVNNASQVLGFPLAIAVLQEIRMVEALQTAKNHAVLGVIRAKREELNQELNKQAEADQQAFVATIQQIADAIAVPTSGTVQKMQKQTDSTNSQIAALLKDIEARSLGKAQ
jgi:3-polyprenyl-4-hydroxybenzoate decarboxylase